MQRELRQAKVSNLKRERRKEGRRGKKGACQKLNKTQPQKHNRACPEVKEQNTGGLSNKILPLQQDLSKQTRQSTKLAPKLPSDYCLVRALRWKARSPRLWTGLLDHPPPKKKQGGNPHGH